MSKALTAAGLVEYVKKCMFVPHIYLWDANGEYITDELLDKLMAQHDYWYTPERIKVRRSLAGRNIRGWDCIGLIKSYVWGDYSQKHPDGYKKSSDFCTRTLVEQPLVKGAIETLPEMPGLVLWKKGHVGVYIGGNSVIEATLRDRQNPDQFELIGGIIKTNLCDTPWEIWLQYPDINY